MKVRKWENYDEYIEAQRLTNRRKSSSVWVRQFVIDCIVEYLDRMEIESGICHGVRTGREVEMFNLGFPTASFIGTDIEAHDDVVEWDFNRERSDWVRRFDLLYSNSFDHAYKPKSCAKTWMGQLSEHGLAFIEWTTYHRTVNRADCFGATLDEYMRLLDDAGKVIDLLYLGDKMLRTLIVVRRNQS